MNPRLLHVLRDRRVVAELEALPSGRLRLRYLDDAAHVGPLSVSMPLSRTRHQDSAIRPWIEGLFPDRPALLAAWRRSFRLTGTNPFDLLAAVGEDVAGGAQFVRPDRLDAVLADPGRLQALGTDDVMDLVRRALADQPIIDPLTALGRFSLAGAQAKVALHRLDDGWALPVGAQPSTHIVKPAIPSLPDQDLVEALTMGTALSLGLEVARVEVLSLGAERVLAVERYDRYRDGQGWHRVHQEDLCQALGLPPARKYEAQGGPGAAQLADLLRRVSATPEQDVQRFAAALVFTVLIGGTDAHARNYSLLHHRGQVRLAPLYDLNSWAAYGDLAQATLSMSLAGEFRLVLPSADRWRWVAADLGLPDEWLLAEVARQRELIPSTLRDNLVRLGPSVPATTRMVRQITSRISGS